MICLLLMVGLDSTAATGVVETLRSLADSGKTIIAVIHQPSQHVFASFDDLLLVSEGKQMYFGDVARVRHYMNTHVTQAPTEMGTAEHILDCISKARMLGESEAEVDLRLHKLADLARAEDVDIGKVDGKLERYTAGVSGGPKANILVQFKLLLGRALRENFRGKGKLVIQTVQQVSLGLIYGGIYTMGTNQVSLQVFCLIHGAVPCDCEPTDFFFFHRRRFKIVSVSYLSSPSVQQIWQWPQPYGRSRKRKQLSPLSFLPNSMGPCRTLLAKLSLKYHKRLFLILSSGS